MDVTKLRALLMEIGNRQFHTVADERRIVGNLNTVKPLFQRITEVIGVWLTTDYTKSNINYATLGGLDEETIFLGTPLSPGTEVIITYIVADGMNDITAQTVIDWARVEVLGDLQDFTLNIDNPTTNEERIAAVYWELLAMSNAYLLLNNVNFVQSDANMSMFNYQTQSKLWGEGMSTDALFARLFQRLEQVRKIAFLLTQEGVSYVSDEISGYWTDNSMITEWIRGSKRGSGSTVYYASGY